MMQEEQARFLEIDDAVGGRRRIAFIHEAGKDDGRPGLVWLPGFKSDMASTKAAALAAWARAQGLGCVRLDYSGHGRSGGRIEEGAIGRWVADVRAVIDQRDRKPLILVGSSMGGWIALLLARALAPEKRIAGLVLIAPAWDMTERLIWAGLGEDIRREIMTKGVWMRPSAYGDGGYPITRRLIEEGRQHLLSGHPFDPRCPVRIIQGMRDADVAWEGSLELVRLISSEDVRLTLVKDGEHRLSREGDIALLLATIGELAGRR